MSVKVASNRFIVSSFKKRVEFYQHICSKVSGFHKLGEWLIAQAEQLQDFRQTEELETVGQMLSNLPFREYELAGQYYLGWCKYRNGEDSRSSFETVIEQSDKYRIKGLTSLAGLEVVRRDYETAVKHYEEAIKWSTNISAFVSAAKSIAAYKSVEGYHRAALKDLEALYPMIRYSTPKVYYDYLNSYTVELTEAGRLEEAQSICRIILASPYAFAYPEWRETEQDLALRGYKSRSSVSVTQQPPNNVVTQVPLAIDEESTTREDNVIKFPHPVDMEKLEQEDKERFSADMKKALELSDNCTLHEFIEDIFMGGMNPERFGKFLMKMSDFKNIKMLLDVIDSMLHQTFLNTDNCKEAEGEWRKSLLEKDS